jgi:hypothetical protein
MVVVTLLQALDQNLCKGLQCTGSCWTSASKRVVITYNNNVTLSACVQAAVSPSQ